MIGALRNARTQLGRAQRAAGDLRPQTWTALRVPRDRQPPGPSAFGRFGDNSWLAPPAEIVGARGIEIGSEVVVMGLASFVVDVAAGARLTIGDRVRLARGVHIACQVSVEIGPAVSTSDHATITDCWGLPGDHALPMPLPPPAPVVIERGAYLGYGSIIGPGVRVGEGAFIGEGAVVWEDVEPHTVVYGNPARTTRCYDRGTREWIGARFP